MITIGILIIMKVHSQNIFTSIILVLLIYYFYYNVYERPYEYFQNVVAKEQESVNEKKNRLEKQLQEFLTFLDGQLCPAIEEIEKSMKEDPNTNVQEKIRSDAGGEIYDCNYSKDLLKIPASIDKIVLRSITYVYKTLSSIQQNIDNSLQCKMPGTTEGFEASSPFVCTPALMEERKKKQDEDQASRCIPPENLKQDQLITFYETRLKTLQTLFDNQTLQTQLASITSLLKKIKDTKQKMEDGTLRPQCDNGDDDAPEPMP